jgi:magnesium chelatase subunit D
MQSQFPYCAVIGQEKAKKALMMLAVNDQLHSVLLSGEKGIGKTVLARGFSALLPLKRRIDIPLNITEDRLFGSIDLEYALKTGEKKFQSGLLAEAHCNMMTVDDIHLMADTSVHAIVHAITTQQYEVEREGLSASFPVQAMLVATMNPEEGELSSGVLDHFGMFVPMKRESDVECRKRIIRVSLAYEQDPIRFVNHRVEETKRLYESIAIAKAYLSMMNVSEGMLELAALTAIEANCRGHRADYYLVEAAKAIAALSNRAEVEADDIRLAAEYVLIHRMRSSQTLERQEQSQRNTGTSSELPPNNEVPSHSQQPETTNDDSRAAPQHAAEQSGEANQQAPTVASRASEIVESIGQTIQARKLSFSAKDNIVRTGTGTGKRSKTKSGTKQGRYVKASYPKGKDLDIAFDATLRAAAPFQRIRQSSREVVWNITRDDLREKVREKRVGVTMLFVVDASRSMAAQKRMQAVKGAVFSLLQDAYQKRDRVGMVAFRQERAEEILPITRSVHLAEKRLLSLPTGGKTPLALGLKKGYELLRQAVMRDPDIVPVMIVLTDGRANVGLQHAVSVQDIIEESRRIAGKVHAAGIQSLVIDTEQGFVKLHQAKWLAKAMKAQYFQIEELDGSHIADVIRTMMKV